MSSSFFPYRNGGTLLFYDNKINEFLNLHFKYVSDYLLALFLIIKPIKLVSVLPKTDRISVSNITPIIYEFLTPITFILICVNLSYESRLPILPLLWRTFLPLRFPRISGVLFHAAFLFFYECFNVTIQDSTGRL